MKIFGYTFIKISKLNRLENLELHARGLLSELENPVPCCVMKKRHKDKINELAKSIEYFK